MRWSPFPRTSSPGSWVGHRRSVRSLEAEVRQQPGSGRALPHWDAGGSQAGGSPSAPHCPPLPSRLCRPVLQQALPWSRSEALRGRCGRSLSSSLPLQVPLFFPRAGSADPQHPWTPRPGGKASSSSDPSTAPAAAEIPTAASLIVVLPF